MNYNILSINDSINDINNINYNSFYPNYNINNNNYGSIAV